MNPKLGGEGHQPSRFPAGGMPLPLTRSLCTSSLGSGSAAEAEAASDSAAAATASALHGWRDLYLTVQVLTGTDSESRDWHLLLSLATMLTTTAADSESRD